MAGTIADKLEKLSDTKADLKLALSEQGQTVGDVFSTYPDAVRAISPGVSSFNGRTGAVVPQSGDYTYSDVGAAASSHTQAASTITAGTFGGQVKARSTGETFSTYCLRNTRLASTETTPTTNGEICWTYG